MRFHSVTYVATTSIALQWDKECRLWSLGRNAALVVALLGAVGEGHPLVPPRESWFCHRAGLQCFWVFSATTGCGSWAPFPFQRPYAWLGGLGGAVGSPPLGGAVRKGLGRALRSWSSSTMLRQNYKPQVLLLIHRGFYMSWRKLVLKQKNASLAGVWLQGSLNTSL